MDDQILEDSRKYVVDNTYPKTYYVLQYPEGLLAGITNLNGYAFKAYNFREVHFFNMREDAEDFIKRHAYDDPRTLNGPFTIREFNWSIGASFEFRKA